METTLELKVYEAYAEDVGKVMPGSVPRISKSINGVLGDVIEIRWPGDKPTVARITGTLPDTQGEKLIQIDGHYP